MSKRFFILFSLAIIIHSLSGLLADNKSQLVIDIQEPIHITESKTFDGTKDLEIINIIDDGALIVDSNAKLELKNLIIIGASNNNIRCADESGKIVLQNVILQLAADYSWDGGNLDVSSGYFCVIGKGSVFFNNGEMVVSGNVQLNAFCDCMYFDIDKKFTLRLQPRANLSTSTYETIRYLSDKNKLFPDPYVKDISQNSVWQSVLNFLGFR
jgi:hypothetical protein